MSTQDIAAAMQRVEMVMRRRPELGQHDDAPATARRASGTRVVASHANGTQMATDMPGELGGTWLEASVHYALAEDVGYQTDTAFSRAFRRAFRREFGSPPAAWRRRHSTPAAPDSARSPPGR